MTLIDLKYGKGHFQVEVPDKNYAGTLLPDEMAGAKDEQAEIARALANPIGSKPLREKLKNGMKVVVIISDVTRPCPSYKFLPLLLDEINAGGVPDGISRSSWRWVHIARPPKRRRRRFWVSHTAA